MTDKTPTKEELLNGQLSVEQIKETVDLCMNREPDKYVDKDIIQIKCKDERYTEVYYPITCTIDEFIEGIKNAKILDSAKLEC